MGKEKFKIKRQKGRNSETGVLILIRVLMHKVYR